MDINLTDTQFFIGLLVSVIILFLGIYAYLVSKLKDTSGVITLEKVDIKAYHNKQTIKLILDGKFLCNPYHIHILNYYQKLSEQNTRIDHQKAFFRQ